MGMEDSKPDVLLDVSADVPASGGAVRVTVAGRGQAAERLAADVAELVRMAVAQALASAPASASPPQLTAAMGDQTVSPLTHAPAAQVALVEAMASAPTHQPQAEAFRAPSAQPWFQRHRARISSAVGLLLIALALLIPLLAPVAMRREILPMPIGLGLVGAISLFSAQLPDAQRRSARTKAQVRMAAPVQAAVQSPAPRAASAAVKPQSITRRVIGLSFGGALALAGLIAPFALPNVSADDRFLMMLGFAPIALIGIFLLWVFLRRPQALAMTAPPAAHRGARSGGALSSATGALAALGVMLGLVVALVVLATVLPLLNAQP